MAEPLKVEKAFDADNHYYEALDAFTRHIEPEYAKRAMQWAEVNGRQMLLVGGKINRFIPNPTFDKLSAPGCARGLLPGQQPEGRERQGPLRRARAVRPVVPRPRRPSRR